MNQTIEITVDTKGEATVQTRGFTGSSCRDASLFLEKALGAVTREQLTPEYHQSHSQHQSQPEPLKQGQ